MTEVAAAAMTRDQAERLTERIRLTATSFMETRDKLARLIREAQEGEAHKALGIASWTEYVSQVFSDTPLMRLSRVERKELVSELADEGMSTRAIAPIVGASKSQIADDLAGVQNRTPAAGPRQITGRDGKTYTRPAPEPVTVDHETGEIMQTKPKRKPITDTARDIGLDLNALTDRINRLMSDDRFDRNRDDIAARLRHHIATATATLNTLDSKIN